jgi:hypothetical protein
MLDHMTKREKGPRAISVLHAFTATGLVLCVAIIIAAGWLGKSDSHRGDVVTDVKARSTTGSR